MVSRDKALTITGSPIGVVVSNVGIGQTDGSYVAVLTEQANGMLLVTEEGAGVGTTVECDAGLGVELHDGEVTESQVAGGYAWLRVVTVKGQFFVPASLLPDTEQQDTDDGSRAATHVTAESGEGESRSYASGNGEKVGHHGSEFYVDMGDGRDAIHQSTAFSILQPDARPPATNRKGRFIKTTNGASTASRGMSDELNVGDYYALRKASSSDDSRDSKLTFLVGELRDLSQREKNKAAKRLPKATFGVRGRQAQFSLFEGAADGSYKRSDKLIVLNLDDENSRARVIVLVEAAVDENALRLSAGSLEKLAGLSYVPEGAVSKRTVVLQLDAPPASTRAVRAAAANHRVVRREGRSLRALPFTLSSTGVLSEIKSKPDFKTVDDGGAPYELCEGDIVPSVNGLAAGDGLDVLTLLREARDKITASKGEGEIRIVVWRPPSGFRHFRPARSAPLAEAPVPAARLLPGWKDAEMYSLRRVTARLPGGVAKSAQFKAINQELGLPTTRCASTIIMRRLIERELRDRGFEENVDWEPTHAAIQNDPPPIVDSLPIGDILSFLRSLPTRNADG